MSTLKLPCEGKGETVYPCPELLLEKSKLEDQLHKIDISLNSLTVLFSETLKNQISIISNIQTMLNKHNSFIFGDEKNQGLATRIDRLEISENHHKWTLRTTWTIIIGMVIKFVYDLIGGVVKK